MDDTALLDALRLAAREGADVALDRFRSDLDVESELPLPTRRRWRLLEAGASCFNDALCRHNRSVHSERSLHRRSFGVTHS